MKKKKILMIDDEADLCELAKGNLEATGRYEVTTETRGARALFTARKVKPDLIILDFIMPDTDGSEVLHQLEGDPGTKGIPVVFLTAIATKDDTAQDAGALIAGRYVVAKPIKTEELIRVIEENLRRG